MAIMNGQSTSHVNEDETMLMMSRTCCLEWRPHPVLCSKSGG